MNKDEKVKSSMCIADGLIKEGHLIEAGWQALRIMSIREHTTPHELHDLRLAFFAGAHCMFSSLMHGAAADKSPNGEEGLRRISALEFELERFIHQCKEKNK